MATNSTVPPFPPPLRGGGREGGRGGGAPIGAARRSPHGEGGTARVDPLPQPLPARAGESHVRGAKLLRWKKNLILTMSPDSRGGCPGPLCRMLFAVGPPSEDTGAAR